METMLGDGTGNSSKVSNNYQYWPRQKSHVFIKKQSFWTALAKYQKSETAGNKVLSTQPEDDVTAISCPIKPPANNVQVAQEEQGGVCHTTSKWVCTVKKNVSSRHLKILIAKEKRKNSMMIYMRIFYREGWDNE